MDRFLPVLFSAGAIATLGKGPRSEGARDIHKEFGAVYLAAVGGIGALFAHKVASIEPVAWADLGAEAVSRITFDGFPAIVAIDATGDDHLARQYESHRQGQR
jgi:fumarate hydratase subunit beta